MVRTATIHKEDVAEAMKHLREQGDSVSVNKIILHIGRGSASTVAPLLKELREEEQRAAPKPVLDPALPEQVKTALTALLQKQAGDLYATLIAPVEARSKQIDADLQAEREDMAREVEAAQVDVVQMNEALEIERSRTAAQNEQIGRLKGHIEELMDERTRTTDRYEKQIEAILARHREELTRLDASHAQVVAAKADELQQLRSQLDAVSADLATANGRADTLAQQVQAQQRQIDAHEKATSAATDSLQAERIAHERTRSDQIAEREAARAERLAVAQQLKDAAAEHERIAADLRKRLEDSIATTAELRGRNATLAEAAAPASPEMKPETKAAKK